MITTHWMKQYGAGIVELMVGIFVGVILLLAITGSTSFYQATKSTSISGNNAFSNAIFGTYLLGKDIKQAGLGLTIGGQLACTTLNAYYNGVTRSDGGLVSPINLTDGGDNPDQISMMYGNSVFSGAPSRLLTSMTTAIDPVITNMSLSGQTGESALLAAPASNFPCTLIGITNTTLTANGTSLDHAPVLSLYNPPDPNLAYSDPVLYPADSYLINVGVFRWLTYRVNNSVLEVVDNVTGAVSQIADNIVQLQSEYGITNGVTPDITTWQSATDDWELLDADTIPRIRAIRIALVARSTQRERNVDADGNCNTTTQDPISWPGSPALNLSDDPNWQCYRYRVIRVVYPLKNIVWGIQT